MVFKILNLTLGINLSKLPATLTFLTHSFSIRIRTQLIQLIWRDWKTQQCKQQTMMILCLSITPQIRMTE